MNYSLIIPIYNEERTLKTLIHELKKLNDNIEIIIVDDGSDDNTKNILSFEKDLNIIQNNINKGKGYAIRTGIEHSKNDNIILIDGDMEIDINSIPKIISLYEKNDNVPITGIRWKKNDFNIFDINRLGNYIINALFNLTYSSNYNDVLCCVKIIDKNLIKSLELKSDGFSIEVEIIAKLILNKIILDEIKISYKRRSIGEGKKLKFSDTWNILKSIIFTKFIGN